MKAIIFAAVALVFSVSQASAVSLAVKLACKQDYFAHCSMHSPGSAGVRKCMRAVGSRLSSRCIGALADAGMIKSSKVASKRAVRANRTFARKATSKKYAAKKFRSKKYATKRISKKYATKRVSKKYATKRASRKVTAQGRPFKKRYANKKFVKKYASRD